MPAKNGRNVSLAAKHEAFVQRMLADGRYASASEVVRDGLRLLERQEQQRLLEKWLTEGLTASEQATLPAGLLEKAREQINRKVREGLDSLASGEGIAGDAFFKRWRQKLDLARKVKPRVRRSA